MGYGGVATVAVDVIAALTVLPALLAVLGHRVNALARQEERRRRAPRQDETEGGWYRLAHSVMRRPVVFASVIVVVLLALGAPFLQHLLGRHRRPRAAGELDRPAGSGHADQRVPRQLDRPDRGRRHRRHQPGAR